jgi:hypothetical protein
MRKTQMSILTTRQPIYSCSMTLNWALNEGMAGILNSILYYEIVYRYLVSYSPLTIAVRSVNIMCLASKSTDDLLSRCISSTQKTASLNTRSTTRSLAPNRCTEHLGEIVPHGQRCPKCQNAQIKKRRRAEEKGVCYNHPNNQRRKGLKSCEECRAAGRKRGQSDPQKSCLRHPAKTYAAKV